MYVSVLLFENSCFNVTKQLIISLFCFQKYEKLAKAQLKKVTKIYAQEKKKSEEKDKKEVLEILEFLIVCIILYLGMDTLKADSDILTLPTNNELTKFVLIGRIFCCVDQTYL